MFEIKRDPNETEEQFLWRVGQLVDSGDVENWASINDTVNKALGIDEEKWRDESSFRKRYQAAKKFYDGCFSKMTDEEYQAKLDVLNRELARNTIKYRDSRNAWSKQNYADTRIDETLELLEERIQELGKINFAEHDEPEVVGDHDLLVTLADLHLGQCFSSYWGEYNSDIAKQRMDKYLNKVIEVGQMHNASKVHVACLGDEISGAIHSTIQITNKENVIEQVKLAIEMITSFCYELTKHFEHVYFYEVDGNHSRLTPKKDDTLKNERLDDLIGWSVCNSLLHISNFHNMMHRRIDSTIAEANIRGNNYLLIHGDVDSISKSGIGSLSLMLGFIPQYVITGHLHTHSMNEFNGVTVYQAGSLAGSGDDYTVQHRLCGKPSQTILVCDENGVDCCYNVTLN